jgi:hypothetical protein
MSASSTPLHGFAVAVTCIDGRTHDPLVRWAREHLDVDYLDLVTQPGADAALSECPLNVCSAIRQMLDVSVNAHASRAVVIAGHDDCAANPVPADVHRRQILDAVRQVEGWGMDLTVVGVWIDHDGTVTPVEQFQAVRAD